MHSFGVSAPFNGDAPDQKEVTSLLNKLSTLKKGWPVATSSDAAKCFKVIEASHERQIVLKSGEDWMDRNLLNVAQDKITSIAVGDLTLERTDGTFILAGFGPKFRRSSARLPALHSTWPKEWAKRRLPSSIPPISR